MVNVQSENFTHGNSEVEIPTQPQDAAVLEGCNWKLGLYDGSFELQAAINCG
ncbi:hypothetical protein [Comamonas thiooxydans]|uniref:hypothetical protein n=1 Tax=Comamonas thiooxydans TaxID=363952 RepID=UPI0012E6F7D0|nr:hypothetical protein [Comamonas thiooxydans]